MHSRAPTNGCSCPLRVDEVEARINVAQQRVAGTVEPRKTQEAAELLRYEELLYDRLTGFPTLAVMIERARELLDRRGELTVMYIHFVWYEKIEEIYGWQKLDDVLESTAHALRDFYAREHASSENIMMVSHIADDDFILFTEVSSSSPELAERRLKNLSQQLETYLREQVENAHGEDIASLCGIYVGAATVFRNPKIRTERLIYRWHPRSRAGGTRRGSNGNARARSTTSKRRFATAPCSSSITRSL